MPIELPLPEDGIALEPDSVSPYELPTNKWIEAQDPPLEDVPDEKAADDAPA